MTGVIVAIVAAVLLIVVMAYICAMTIKNVRKEKEDALNMLRESHDAVLSGGHAALQQDSDVGRYFLHRDQYAVVPDNFRETCQYDPGSDA